MFAIIAAVIFGLELLLEIINTHIGSITMAELTTAGLLCIALHLATGFAWRRRR